MILYQLLIQLINMNQEQQSYEVNNDILMNLSQFRDSYFGDEFEVDHKHLPCTQHTEKIPKQVEWSDQENQISPSQNQERDETIQKSPNIIEYNLQMLLKIQSSKKGRPKQIKNINQIFKSQIVNHFSMLAQFKIFDEQTILRVKKFKQKTGSLANYLELLECQTLYNKLIEYYQSPQIFKRILCSERLTHSRKIQVIKHYNILSQIIRLRQGIS